MKIRNEENNCCTSSDIDLLSFVININLPGLDNNAVPIVICTSKEEEDLKFDIDEEAIREVFTQEEIIDLPVALYSIAGRRRGGKSFLLNLLLYYEALGKVSTWSRGNITQASNTICIRTVIFNSY